MSGSDGPAGIEAGNSRSGLTDRRIQRYPKSGVQKVSAGMDSTLFHTGAGCGSFAYARPRASRCFTAKSSSGEYTSVLRPYTAK